MILESEGIELEMKEKECIIKGNRLDI